MAYADLDAIDDYLAAYDTAVANRFLAQITQAVLKLAVTASW